MKFSLSKQFNVFNTLIKEYSHPLNTKLLHFQPKDDLKLKGLLIKLNTFPMNDSGIFHIMEHVVLCGSRNYNIRDPFMKLVQRNLALDMNACTAQDMTYYYAVTDYYTQIRDIYMDAILHPNLDKYDFMQEGWYFDKEIKGVVYNEMKGAMSDINSIYYRGLFKELFPNTIYQYNSGGDPAAIPSLSYDFFLKTHKQFYHPSNMTIMVYGNLDINQELAWFNNYIKSYKLQPTPKCDYPTKIQLGESHFHSTPNNPTFSSINFDLGPLSHFHKFSFSVLSKYLLHLNNSPLFKSLIGKVGHSYTPAVGFHESPINWFSIGVQHEKQHDLFPFISQLKDHKIDMEIIKSILNQLLLQYKHLTPDSASEWMESALTIHSNEFEELLKFDQYIHQLQQDPEILQDLLTRLINQPFHSSFMTPSENKPTPILNPTSMTPTSKADVAGLLENQNKIEDLSVLPAIDPFCLNPPNFPKLTLKSNISFNITDTPLTYYYSLIDVNIKKHLLPYLPLFCQLLMKLDSTNLNNESINLQIRQYTSGIQIAPFIKSSLKTNSCSLKLMISSFTSDHFHELMKLIQILRNEIVFDNEHGLNMVRLHISRNVVMMKNRMPQAGHLFALKYAHSNTSASGKIDEILQGVTQYEHMQVMQKQCIDDIGGLIAILEEIKMQIIKGKTTHFITNKQEIDMRKYDSDGRVTSSTFTLADFDKMTNYEMPVKLSLPVNYLGQSQYVVPYNDENSPYYGLISKLMNPFLHAEIREKGGAYGGGSQFSALHGTMGFYTYRDPNKNYKIFEQGFKHLEGVDEKDLNLAKWSLLRDMDKPVSIDKMGLNEYLYGISNVNDRHLKIKNATKLKLLEFKDSLLTSRKVQTIFN